MHFQPSNRVIFMPRDPRKSPHRHLCVPRTNYCRIGGDRKLSCQGSLICYRTLQTNCFELEINHIWQGKDTTSSPLFCFSPNGRLRRSQCVRPDSANAPVAKRSVSFSSILSGLHGSLSFFFRVSLAQHILSQPCREPEASRINNGFSVRLNNH